MLCFFLKIFFATPLSRQSLASEGSLCMRTLLPRDSIQIHHLLVGWCSILLSYTMLPSSIPFFVSLVEVFLLAQPNMHFRVPCLGDRRSAVTHDHQSLSWLCKYRAGISARSSTKWIKVGFGLLRIYSIFFFSSSSCLQPVLSQYPSF